MQKGRHCAEREALCRKGGTVQAVQNLDQQNRVEQGKADVF